MSAIPDARKLIDALEVKYRRSVSESTWFKIGGMLNFIANRNHQEKQFFLNGPYSIFTPPLFKQDGLTVFEYDATIISVWMFNITSGTAGTTELDCRVKPQNTGAYTSIFTTRPSISYLAGNDIWVTGGTVLANTTAPVLSTIPLNVNRGDGLVVDLINSQTGGENCGLLVHYKPR